MKPRILSTARLSFPLATAISLALTIPSAFAAALTWTGGNGDWQNGIAGGWSAAWNNATPDTGTFNVAGSGTVTVKSAITTGNAALAFTAGDYTLQSDDTTERIITLGNANITLGNGVTTTIGSKVSLSRASAMTFDGNAKATSTLNIDADGKLVTTGSGNVVSFREITANVNTGGTVDIDSSLVVGDTANGATLNVLGGTVNTGKTNADASIVLGNTTATATCNLKITGGSLGFATAGNQHSIRVGNLAGTGTITGTIDLEGGIVTVRRIFENASAHSSTLNLHGGTIRALIDQGDFLAMDNIWIKSGGVTFDSNGRSITVSKDMLTDVSSLGGGLTLNDTAVTKGTLTLSGASITYTGPTVVTAGRLVVPSTHAGTGAATISGNTTLGVNVSGTSQWQPASLTLANPCTLEFNNVQNPGTTTAPLAPAAAVGTVSGVTINLNSLSGTPVAGDSYPLLGNAGSTTGYTLGTQPSGVSGILAVNGTTLVYTVQTVSAIWTGADATNPTFWDIATTANWTSKALNNTPVGTYADGDNVFFDDTAIPASPVAVALQQAVAPGNMIFSNSSKNYTVSGAFGIGGSGTLTKRGSGTLTLGTDNSSYSGTTTVNSGILQPTHNNALGTTAGATTITASSGNATLQLGAATSALSIAENFNFNNAGPSRVFLRNSGAFDHTLSGNINQASTADRVEYYSDNNSGSITISGDITGDMTGSSFLIRGNSTNLNNKLTGNIHITGIGLVKTDASTWTIGGGVGKTYTPASLGVANGILRMGATGYLASAPVLTMGNPTGGSGGTLDLNGFSQTVGGIIYNGAPTSTGTRTITNSDTVNPAVLTVNNATDYSPTAGTLANSVALTGNLGITKQGVGTLTLSGNVTYSGNTTVSEGILSFTPADAPDPLNANPNNDASTVNIAATGATLDLAFTGTDKVAKLFFGATQQPSGTYSASGVPAGATITTASFSGSGTLTVGGGFSSWITGTFAGGATVPALQQGPNDDPDNDGIRNLVEYAVAGEDPTVGNPTIGTFNGTTLSFDKRLPLATDITYAIQDSIDLGLADAWAEVTNTPPNIYVNDGTTISYTLTPGNPPRNFIRLQVSQP